MEMRGGQEKICVINKEESISKCWIPLLDSGKRDGNKMVLSTIMEETDIKVIPIKDIPLEAPPVPFKPEAPTLKRAPLPTERDPIQKDFSM
jgi:hypothetical protein